MFVCELGEGKWILPSAQCSSDLTVFCLLRYVLTVRLLNQVPRYSSSWTTDTATTVSSYDRILPKYRLDDMARDFDIFSSMQVGD